MRQGRVGELSLRSDMAKKAAKPADQGPGALL